MELLSFRSRSKLKQDNVDFPVRTYWNRFVLLINDL